MNKIKVTTEVVITYLEDDGDAVNFVDDIALAVKSVCEDLKRTNEARSFSKVKADFDWIKAGKGA